MACFTKGDIGQCGCSCTLPIEVLGCFNGSAYLPVGSGVTVNLKVGGSTIYTGTTNSSGVASITGAAGVYDIEVVDGRTPSRWATATNTGTSTSCGSTTSVYTGAVNSGFHCSLLCGDPLADTLYATDANGTWTLTYDAGNPNGVGWYSCATKTSMASVVTNLNAGVCTKITGTANTPYFIKMTTGATLSDTYGQYAAPGAEQTSATPTCSSGTLNLNATIPVSCLGAITAASASTSGTMASCPPSLSITATMPSTGSNSTANPGAGSITITE